MKLQLKFLHMFKLKNVMAQPTCELLHQGWQKYRQVQMDNAGKNKKLVMRLQSRSWKNPVVVEYTARDTPQQKSPVKVGVYALANKAWATMHHTNLTMEMHYHQYGEMFTQ